MTRSSTKELFTPFKNPEREFHLSRKLFKTLSLDESNSPEFDLFYDLEEITEEEVAETMAKTMEEYMCKTRGDYESGVARPKIDDKDHFELKGQFLKELHDNTFSGSDHEDANEHNERVIKTVDLFHIPNITQDQIMLRAFPMSLTGAASRWLRNKPSVMTRQILDSKGAIPTKTTADAKKVNEKVYAAQVGCELCKGPHYTKDCPLKKEGKTLEEAYYTQFGVRFQQGGQYRTAAPGFYQRNNANLSYQERRQSMEESLSKFMNESTKRHKENSNLIKKIRSLMDTAIRNQGASIKALEIQIRQISKVLQERRYGSLPSLTETNPRDHVNSILTTVEADTTPIRHIGSTQYAISTQQNSKQIFKSKQATIPFPSHLNAYYCDEKGSYGPQYLDAYSYVATRLDDFLPRKEKDPGSFTLPCYINNVCFEKTFADLGASVSVMPLSTYLNLGLGELAHTKLTVELADRTVKHPKGIDENVLVGIGDEKIILKSVKPAISLIKRVYMLSLRERMDLDSEARLMGETLILNRSLDPLYGDYIELNDLNVPLELRRDHVDNLRPIIEEGEAVDKSMIEDVKTMNGDKMVSRIIGYPNDYDQDEKILMEDMRDVVVGEPFCEASCVEARRFDGIITIRDEDDSVTYHMDLAGNKSITLVEYL
ncbi:zf-CCHC domain-containing protein [Tanacetum coccineum]